MQELKFWRKKLLPQLIIQIEQFFENSFRVFLLQVTVLIQLI